MVSDEIVIRPFSKARWDALRDLPFMGQVVKAPIVQQLRHRLNRGFFKDVVDLPDPTTSGFGFAIEALLSPVLRIREIATGMDVPAEIVFENL